MNACRMSFPDGVDAESSGEGGWDSIKDFEDSLTEVQEIADLAASSAAQADKYNKLSETASGWADLFRQIHPMINGAGNVQPESAEDQARLEQLWTRADSLDSSMRAECRKIFAGS